AGPLTALQALHRSGGAPPHAVLRNQSVRYLVSSALEMSLALSRSSETGGGTTNRCFTFRSSTAANHSRAWSALSLCGLGLLIVSAASVTSHPTGRVARQASRAIHRAAGWTCALDVSRPRSSR